MLRELTQSTDLKPEAKPCFANGLQVPKGGVSEKHTVNAVSATSISPCAYQYARLMYDEDNDEWFYENDTLKRS